MTEGLVGLVHELRADYGILSGRVRDHDVLLADQEKLAADVAQLSEQLADLQLKVGLDDTKGKGYKPAHNPRWWSLGSEPQAKAAELGRLRGWLKDIAGPFLGTRGFPDCVLDHDVTLLLVDAACETWKTLWLPESRSASTAAAQCEYLTRIWPAIRAEVVRLTNGCAHQSGLAGIPQIGVAS